MGMGHLWLKWVGRLWQSELLLFGRCSNPPQKTGDYPFQSLHHGFRSLWTPNLLQKGWDHFPPKACFKWRAQLSVGIHRAMSILITKQIGGGSQWVELVIIKGTSEPIVVDLLLSRLGGASGRFGGRNFCTKDFFAEHLGLHCGNFLVSILPSLFK